MSAQSKESVAKRNIVTHSCCHFPSSHVWWLLSNHFFILFLKSLSFFVHLFFPSLVHCVGNLLCTLTHIRFLFLRCLTTRIISWKKPRIIPWKQPSLLQTFRHTLFSTNTSKNHIDTFYPIKNTTTMCLIPTWRKNGLMNQL